MTETRKGITLKFCGEETISNTVSIPFIVNIYCMYSKGNITHGSEKSAPVDSL